MSEDVPETIYSEHLSFHQIQQIRICSISSATASILLGLVFIYFFGMIHPTRRHFRHFLILLLIAFDFIKAIAILVFSCVSFNGITTNNKSLIQGMGWLTVFGIEGGDIVILMFAIHMALLIFNSQLSQLRQKLLWKSSNVGLSLHGNRQGSIPLVQWLARKWRYLANRLSGKSYTVEKGANGDTEDDDDGERETVIISRRRSEGGLYHNRFWVVLITFLFPVLVSSVSFYIHRAYEEYVYWSFFRVWTGPWYFSWTVRHVIVVVIMIIYISIYVYVMLQFKSVSRSLKKQSKRSNLDSDSDEDGHGNPHADRGDNGDDYDDDSEDEDVFLNTFGDSLWYKFFKFLSMLVFPDVRISAQLHGHDLTTNEDLLNIEKLKNESIMNESVNWSNNNNNNNNNGYGNDVSSSEILGLNSSFANVQNKEISKQIQNLLYEEAMERFAARKSQIMRQMKVIFIYPISYICLWLLPFINHYQIIRTGTESLWSTAPSAIFQALNCFVDVLVFLIREKPWQLTKSVDDLTRMTSYSSRSSSGMQSSSWRRRFSWLPGYGDYSVILEPIDSTDEELGKGNLSNRVACGRNSTSGVHHEDDELYDDYDDYDPNTGNCCGEHNIHDNRNSNSNIEDNALEGADNAGEGEDEIDLMDFLGSNSPRHSSHQKKHVKYHSVMGKSRSKPGSLSTTAASSSMIESFGPGRHPSLTSSNKSNRNSRRNSRLSWHTWSLGSNPSNGAGRQRHDRELDPISDVLINENSPFDNKCKLREGPNYVNWNLHMFDHTHRRAYEGNGNMKNTNYNNNKNISGSGTNRSGSSSNNSSYRHNSGGSNNNYNSSNNGSYRHSSNGSNNINNHRGNKNASCDDEMDLMDFLKLRPGG